MQQTDKVQDLQAIAKEVRRDIIEMITAAKVSSLPAHGWVPKNVR